MIDPHSEKKRNRSLLVGLVVGAILFLLFLAAVKSCEAATWEVSAQAILAGPDPVKADLVRQALAHQSQPFRAHTVYYHPSEAGTDWRRWSRTATGTLVRPGVASCTQANRNRWMGAWVYFEGYGVAHVEDCFPEASSPTMFDLAVWAQPGQSYSEWLRDPTRVVIARTRNLWTDAVLLKPPHGWGKTR